MATDKPSNLQVSAQKLSFFAHAAIQFGVPGWVARDDAVTIFNTWLPRLPGDIFILAAKSKKSLEGQR